MSGWNWVVAPTIAVFGNGASCPVAAAGSTVNDHETWR